MYQLLQVSADDLNHVLRGFLGRFRILRHMVDDVVFHEFTHQAVNGSTGSSETAKNLGAWLVAVQALEYRLELADDFLVRICPGWGPLTQSIGTFFLTILPG